MLNAPDGLEVINVILQVIASLAMLPILIQQSSMLIRFWGDDREGLQSTRVVIVAWCSVLTFFGAWRIYYWWFIWYFDSAPSYSWLASFITSLAFCIAAIPSVIAFWRRQQAINIAIKRKLQEAGIQTEKQPHDDLPKTHEGEMTTRD